MFWKRSATLQIGSRRYDMSNLYFEFDVPFKDSDTLGTASITVHNLADATRKEIVKGTPVILNAGYEGDIGVIFTGKVSRVVDEHSDTEWITKITGVEALEEWLSSEVNKTYAEKHPDITTKFLQIYQRGVEYMRNTPMDKLVEEYLRFYTDWAGAEYTAELAKRDLAAHNTYTLTDLEAAFDTNNGPSRVQQWFTHLAEFLEHSGRITRQELNKIHASGYITNKYIGLAAEEARAGKAQ